MRFEESRRNIKSNYTTVPDTRKQITKYVAICLKFGLIPKESR
jgi:hypothetical protein